MVNITSLIGPHPENPDGSSYTQALAALDRSGAILERMLALPGRGSDLRILSGYLGARKKREKTDWIDDWLDDYEKKHPDDIVFLFDATWRSAPTDRGVRRVTRFVREGKIVQGQTGALVYGGWCLEPTIEPLKELLAELANRPEHQSAALALAHQRISESPCDWDALAATTERLISDGKFLRNGGTMVEHYWRDLAMRLIPAKVRVIVRAIFEAQKERGHGSWFIEHSESGQVLEKCLELDNAAVWDELVQFLDPFDDAYLFQIGFPINIVERCPREKVWEWVKQIPSERAILLARMTMLSLNDESFSAQLLDRYGYIKEVASEFFAEHMEGTWAGPASTHWEGRAANLEAHLAGCSLAGVKKWAVGAIREYRRMAARERKREEEEELRGPSWG